LVELWVVAGLGWFASIIKLLASEMKKQAKTLEHKIEHQVKISSPVLIESNMELYSFRLILVLKLKWNYILASSTSR